MQSQLTRQTWPADGARRPSPLAASNAPGRPDEPVAVLTLGERVVLLVGIEAACLAIQAAEILDKLAAFRRPAS